MNKHWGALGPLLHPSPKLRQWTDR